MFVLARTASSFVIPRNEARRRIHAKQVTQHSAIELNLVSSNEATRQEFSRFGHAVGLSIDDILGICIDMDSW